MAGMVLGGGANSLEELVWKNRTNGLQDILIQDISQQWLEISAQLGVKNSH